jgi:hypothetical protein
MYDEKKDDVRISLQSMDSDDSIIKYDSSRATSMEEAHELLEKEEGRHDDLEAQSAAHAQTQQTTPTPVEYSVSTHRKFLYLGLYFILNLSVTLSNKALLRTVSCDILPQTWPETRMIPKLTMCAFTQASYPWLLTFSHTFATSIGCTLLLLTGQLKLSKLNLREHLTLVAFSTLFTLNIAISNVSLYVSFIPRPKPHT